MSNQSQIAIVNDYPSKDFNLLIPMKTLQEISPMHKVVVNEVLINADHKNGKDVYLEKNGELALSKKTLAKLMAASNIQVVNSLTVMPAKCKRCAEIAGKTKLAPNCGTCPNADDVAHQVTLAVPEPSGMWRTVKCTKEIRMPDEAAKMTANQYKTFFPFRSEQCETKALNRALREALMISSTYRTEELKKPFVVAYIVPNMNDPEMKKVMAAQYASSMSMMFGGNGEVKQLSQATVIGPDDDPEDLPSQQEPPVIEAEVIPPGETPPWTQEEPADKKDDGITCEGCAEPIVANGSWKPENIRDYSKRTFGGKVLCPACQKKAKAGGQA